MIRRHSPLGENPKQWTLVTQANHAAASGQLAALWTPGDTLLAPPWRDALLKAIAHHDDGWLAWDAAPAIDPQHHRPRSFTEMPPRDSLAIWQQSIVACGQHSPLAGYAVAGHFLRLLADSQHAKQPFALTWASDMARLQQQWLAGTTGLTGQMAAAATQLVRVFDWLSLWLCCYCPTDTSDVTTLPTTTVDDSAATSTPVQLAHLANNVVEVTPWCFTTTTVDIELAAQNVPAQHYVTAEQLLACATPTRLVWHLRPRNH
jgi:hypothetical protein